MKTKKNYFKIIILITVILFYRCNENDILTSEFTSIKYLSFQSNGCISTNDLLKTNDKAVFDWFYLNGSLRIGVSFSTHCSASLKDSVLIANNIINIFLADTSTIGSRCICPHREVFDFRVSGNKKLEITFSYMSYSKTEFYVLADTTIYLE